MTDERSPGQIAYEAFIAALDDGHTDWWTWADRGESLQLQWESAATAVREADVKEIADLRAEVASLKAENEGLADWIFESMYHGGI